VQQRLGADQHAVRQMGGAVPGQRQQHFGDRIDSGRGMDGGGVKRAGGPVLRARPREERDEPMTKRIEKRVQRG
jgi:hypothetical protein